MYAEPKLPVQRSLDRTLEIRQSQRWNSRDTLRKGQIGGEREKTVHHAFGGFIDFYNIAAGQLC